MSDELEKLDGEDSAILNKRGWFLVTYYQTRDGDENSNAFNLCNDSSSGFPCLSNVISIFAFSNITLL